MDLVPVDCFMFDSGPVHGSYIAKEWVDQRWDMLRPYHRRVIGMASIGDNQKLGSILEMLRAKMVYPCAVKVTVELTVMPINYGINAIIDNLIF